MQCQSLVSLIPLLLTFSLIKFIFLIISHTVTPCFWIALRPCLSWNDFKKWKDGSLSPLSLLSSKFHVHVMFLIMCPMNFICLLLFLAISVHSLYEFFVACSLCPWDYQHQSVEPRFYCLQISIHMWRAFTANTCGWISQRNVALFSLFVTTFYHLNNAKLLTNEKIDILCGRDRMWL